MAWFRLDGPKHMSYFAYHACFLLTVKKAVYIWCVMVHWLDDACSLHFCWLLLPDGWTLIYKVSFWMTHGSLLQCDIVHLDIYPHQWSNMGSSSWGLLWCEQLLGCLWLFVDWLVSTSTISFLVNSKYIRPVSLLDEKFGTAGPLMSNFSLASTNLNASVSAQLRSTLPSM